jgi:hypothetical protein
VYGRHSVIVTLTMEHFYLHMVCISSSWFDTQESGLTYLRIFQGSVLPYTRIVLGFRSMITYYFVILYLIAALIRDWQQHYLTKVRTWILLWSAFFFYVTIFFSRQCNGVLRLQALMRLRNFLRPLSPPVYPPLDANTRVLVQSPTTWLAATPTRRSCVSLDILVSVGLEQPNSTPTYQ